MLSYAFQVLKQSNYEEIAAEEFSMAQDLFAAVLAKGVARQVKQGLYREYIVQHESLTTLRGKLDMAGTIRNRMERKPKLACAFDELSENNLYNQILKTTMHYLLRDEGVDRRRKAALNKVLVFFDEVDLLEPFSIPWKRLHIPKSSKTYELLLTICGFVLNGMLQTTEKGRYRMAAFSDAHMARLYERFILEYYRQHHAYLDEIKAAQVKWNVTGKSENGQKGQENEQKVKREKQEQWEAKLLSLMPVMQTDIFLRYREKSLIIDAKYYGQTLQRHYDRCTLHSQNLYQIFTYVKNQDKENTGNVSGLLLYAKTDEAIVPGGSVCLGGNRIGAETLDLNVDFREIARQLDSIAGQYLGV